ncbi:MAG: LCP family protein [Clostridia bacterium]
MSKIAKIILISVLVVVLVCAGLLIFLMKSMQKGAVGTEAAPEGFFDDTDVNFEQLAEATPSPDPGPAEVVTVQTTEDTPMPIYETESKNGKITNILLIGTDAREPGTNAEGRSDTMIAVSYNSIENKMYFISFMRDAQVMRIGERSKFKGKLNAAYNGGVGELINTLNLNFDLGLQDYVSVGFDGFGIIIDGIGGLELKTTAEEAYRVNWRCADLLKADDKRDYKKILTAKGKSILTDDVDCTQKVTGEQLLWYCRDRYSTFIEPDGTLIKGGDAARIARQQYVISEAFKKITTNMDWKSLLALYQYASQYMQTDMDLASLVDLGASIFNNKPEFIFVRIPEKWSAGADESGNETSDLIFDIKKTKKSLHEMIYGTEATPSPVPEG